MSTNRPAAGRLLAAVAALGLTATMLVAVPAAAQAPSGPVRDGSSQAQAAASCWEIVQQQPGAPDGVYWLQTPTLVAPQQFYCDMTTDGGGWVLVGRGRDGWQQWYEGVGTSDQVHTPHTGTGAFNPRQLASTTIDGLLDGGRVDALQEGIRLRRATNAAGTSWQEARLRLRTRDRWVWTFEANHPLVGYSFDGVTSSGGATANVGTNNTVRRVDTRAVAAQGWQAGFAFGSQTTGTSGASSFLWSQSNGAGGAIPFTQVFLRPRLRSADLTYPQLPDAGTPAQEQSPLFESRSTPLPWGVSGLANGLDGELHTEVQGLAEAGGRLFVGGNFREVRNGANGQVVVQPRLAAFDIDTGQWISSFRPQVDDTIKFLATLPDGNLAIAGQFRTYNGQPATGFVVVDPVTGERVRRYDVTIENRLSTGTVIVRAIDVQDGWIYLGGGFTHLAGGSRTTPIYARHAARIALADATPDPTWNPEFDGTVIDIDASERGDRLYAAGYFATSRGARAYRTAAVGTAAGAALATPAWEPAYSSGDRANYQQAVLEVGERVWLGGSEHSLFSFDRTTFQRTSSNILNRGGDLQTAMEHDGVVYAGCHCYHWNFSDATRWPDVGTGWTQADKVGWVGAWDADTTRIIPDFNPVVQARRGHGVWAKLVDSRGRLWFGGDFTSSLGTSGAGHWVGGFLRFGPRDTSAPTTPGQLAVATPEPGSAQLSWQASTDDRGAVSYEVLRDDRVVVTTTATSATVPIPDGDARVVVRAVDRAGNRSASTPVTSLVTPPDSALATFVEEGSTWSWRFASTSPPAAWTDVAFDDGGWSSGAAPLGFGSSWIATDIDVPSGTQRPLSAQFRRTFEVEDPSQLSAVVATVVADDGVVVHVNGTEIGRANLPDGPLTAFTWASSPPPRTPTARANPASFVVPPALLRTGMNVVTAQTHLNYRATPDASFDLGLTGLLGAPDLEPPAPPVVSAAQVDDDVVVSWDPVADDDVLGYRVERDGEQVAFVAADVTSWTDVAPTPGSYEYGVRAVDQVGNASEPGRVTVTVAAPEEPGEPDEVTLIDLDADWRWRYEPGTVPAGWSAPAFDDGTWSLGAAPLGFGSGVIATDIDVPSGTQRPLSAQFRHTFEVDDADGLADLTITTVADDGVVVHVNGTEVGRANLPDGPLTANSYALAPPPRTPTARANPVTFTVPRWLLQDGANTVTASTHVNYRATPDVSFELRLTATRTDEPPEPGPVADLIADTASWRWRYEAGAFPAGWTDVGFDDTGWAQGPAWLGFGSAGLGTDIDVPAGTQRPLAAQFRHRFTVTDPGALPPLEVTTVADDGVVVFLNGVELGRSRLPVGAVTAGTYALAPPPRTAAARANPVTFTVPPSALRAGDNVVSASVHVNYRATPDVSFGLRLGPLG